MQMSSSLASKDGNQVDVPMMAAGTNPLYNGTNEETTTKTMESKSAAGIKGLTKKGSFRRYQDEHGRDYYHCDVSGKVQWKQPEEHEMKPTTHDSVMDPESGRLFYVNKKTRRRTWTDHDA